jgi:ribosomal protein L7/L12
MYAPGSKGWIAKYFQLIEAGEIKIDVTIPDDFSRDEYYHYSLSQTGIIFGYPSKLLFTKQDLVSKWTLNEQLVVLLFESLLMVHITSKNDISINKDEFLNDLYLFYKKYKTQSLSSVFTFFLKESLGEKIEKVLDNRINLPVNIVSTKMWMSYFNNSFVYLDVLLFDDFLRNKKKQTLDYQKLALLALGVISVSAYSDGEPQEYEKNLFQAFLISADLESDEKELAKLRFKDGISLNELNAELVGSWNFKRYLLNVAILTMHMNQNSDERDIQTLMSLQDWLECTDRDVEEAIYSTDKFLLTNSQRLSYLTESSSFELMLDSVSKRWIKILGRNKDKLAKELKESKELVSLIRKSTTTDLSKEEKEKVKTQFMDIVKSMPALAIFLLPGGALLLPIVLKIIPSLIPSAFKDNELGE